MLRIPNLMIAVGTALILLWIAAVPAEAQGEARWQPTIAAAAEGRWADVVAQTKSAETDKKAPAQIILLRAVGLMRLNNPVGAARTARLAIRKDPTVVEGYLTAAEADRQSGQHDSAAVVLRRALRRFPDDARLHMSLGLGLAVTGRCDEAIAPLEEAMYRRPSNLAIVKQLAQCLAAINRTAEAVDLYNQILEFNPADRAVLTALAEALVALGYSDSAISLYDGLWKGDSSNVRIGVAYAAALHDGKRYAQAAGVLRTVSNLAPDSASIWYNLGVACFAAAMPDSAIRAYRKAIQLQPTFPEAYYNMGIAYDNRGFVEDAVVAFKRCAVQDRELASAAYNRIAEVMRNQNRIDDALEFHDQALAIDGNNVHLMAAKGHTFLVGNRYTEAIAYLEPLVTRFPDRAEVLHALARHYVRIGRRAEAESAAQILDSMNPSLASDIREMMK
jgi:tetratricopeptide (TPR) repeat protein